MRSYRPYETFGILDQECRFETVDALTEFYVPWCKENAMQMECVFSDECSVIFGGTSLIRIHELLEDGISKEEAIEQAYMLLLVEDCTEEQVQELEVTFII